MTINVSIEQEDEGNGNNVHVAIVNRDAFGNPMMTNANLTQLKVGEKRTFCLHGSQELRVYETDQDLAESGHGQLPPAG